MNKADYNFKENLKKILREGSRDINPRAKYKDGTPAHSLFITGVFETYDLEEGEYPITTLRNTSIKTGIKEILWIYQKQTNSLQTAKEMGINWWNDWNIGDGTIGKRYGWTIKKWDLMNKLLTSLKEDPFSRRHIIDMYQYQDLESSKGLYPCAYSTTWSIREKNGEFYLDMTLNQRSSDYIMANYINKSQYLAFMMMVASHLNYKLGKFCHMVQNLHIYDRHIEAANEILSREPKMESPIIKLINNKNFYQIKIEDFLIENNNGEKLKSPLEIAI